MTKRHFIGASVFVLILLSSAFCRAATWDKPISVAMPAGFKSVAFAMSPKNGRAIAIVREDIKGGALKLYSVDLATAAKEEWLGAPLPTPSNKEEWLATPDGATSLSALAWHPDGAALFAIGIDGKGSAIWRGDFAKGLKWRAIYRSTKHLHKLVVSPEKFENDHNREHKIKEGAEKTADKRIYLYHRLYFGVEIKKGQYGIGSVSELGDVYYELITPEKVEMTREVENYDALLLDRYSKPFALPAAFHPGGFKLYWKDKENKFHSMTRQRERWSMNIEYPKICENTESENISCHNGIHDNLSAISGGEISPTPNGRGFARWREGKAGVDFYLDPDMKKSRLADGVVFELQPQWTWNGKMLVGIVKSGTGERLEGIPYDSPLADAMNAWMFIENEGDGALLEKNGGLFRNTHYQQLYSLYDTENYNMCGMPDYSIPRRPYLVTTDAFWETFAASFEGLFQTFESRLAAPAFWDFINSAYSYNKKNKGDEKFETLIETIYGLKNPKAKLSKKTAAQVAEIKKAIATGKGKPQYLDLKPRGHYTKSGAMKTYFTAFRLLANEEFTKEGAGGLRKLPDSLKKKAFAFIQPYLYFIGSSRYDMVWPWDGFKKPDYVKHLPKDKYRIFPKGFAFDNEILNSTVYHEDWPKEDRTERLIPSGLDIANVFGNTLANEIHRESGTFKQYPELVRIMGELKTRRPKLNQKENNLYASWMEALGTQWSSASAPKTVSDRLWRTKRLQTGLASWATLRHTTLLVNERVSAECGEGGYFEILVLPKPKGRVEPDPATFKAIAALFELEMRFVKSEFQRDLAASGKGKKDDENLVKGLLRRLEESRDDALRFGAMAQKQIDGKELTEKEYDSIMTFAGVAEHNFLVFKTLSQDEYGMSEPDPIPKIADVADVGNNAPYTHAAVGLPLEWDIVMPDGDMKTIAKGAVYSYFEFQDDTILSDQDWLKKLGMSKPEDEYAPYEFSDSELEPIFWTRAFYSRKGNRYIWNNPMAAQPPY